MSIGIICKGKIKLCKIAQLLLVMEKANYIKSNLKN